MMKKITFIILLIFSTLSVFANIDSLQQKINYFVSQAQFDSAKTFIQDQLNNNTKNENRTELNYQLVKVLFIQSDYNESLKQAYAALDKIDDEKEKIKFNFIIGCIYSAINDYTKSIEYFDLVTTHSIDTSLLVQTHLLLCELHIEIGDSTNALNSITKAYEITSKSKADSQLKNHVAMQYSFYSKDYETCKQLNLKTIKDSTVFLSTKSYAYSMVGECYLKQDSLKKAAIYLDEFLNLTFETKDPEQIKVAAEKLIQVYEKLGNQEKANSYHRIYNNAKNDSLSFSLEKYRELYTTEKNRELEQVKSKNSRNTLLLITLLITLAIVTFYFIYTRKKNKSELPINKTEKSISKKIVISNDEIEKIKNAIEQLISKQLFLKSGITRKTFCAKNKIKSERYISQYINDEYKKSFSIFINDLRIEYAHNRVLTDLKFRNYTIEAIAEASGFGSKKSFERVFTAKYNETPFKFISNLKA